MAGLTYDAGALIAAERGDRKLWTLHRRALERELSPVVPAAVLAQVWRGGPQPSLSRFLRGCVIDGLDESAARMCGVVLAASETADVVDASVVVGAAHRGDAIVTGDSGDLERLAAGIGADLTFVSL